MRNIIIFLLAMTLICGLIVLSDDHQYLGAVKCKMCHIKQFKSWEKSRHANTLSALSPEEQKKVECIQCHATGFGKAPELLPGVQCEACHGPGSDYLKMNIMKDKTKAEQAGLVMPSEETCIQCHNEKSPTFKGFNFEAAKKTGPHEMKPK